MGVAEAWAVVFAMVKPPSASVFEFQAGLCFPSLGGLGRGCSLLRLCGRLDLAFSAVPCAWVWLCGC